MALNLLPFPFLILVLVPLPLSAQVYRWADADGRVHMGDRLPAGVQATRVYQKPASSAPMPAGDDAQTRERMRQERENWEAINRSRLMQPAATPSTARALPPDVPRGTGTHAAPQGNCAYYEYLLQSARTVGIRGCNRSSVNCWKASPSEVEMLEREAREACSKV